MKCEPGDEKCTIVLYKYYAFILYLLTSSSQESSYEFKMERMVQTYKNLILYIFSKVHQVLSKNKFKELNN